VLKGNEADSRFPSPPELREYYLAKKFGWTKQQIDEQPAVWLDWMLQIDGVYESVVAESGAHDRDTGFGR
jgi:hypothetical protein